MSISYHQQIKHPATAAHSGAIGLLQRKCACGGTPGPTGECEECSKKRRFGLQTKLKVSESGDLYEQEADRIADQVMARPAHTAISNAPPRLHRFSGQSNGQMDEAPASVDQALASPGRPLEPALRQDMEQRFDYDFSSVRVHADAAAEQSAQDVYAHAYTVAHNIVFGAGRFAPGTHQGRRLIAHELTHVVQQSGATSATVRRQVDPKQAPAADDQPPLFTVFVADPHKRWDKRFARQQGQADAARIQKSESGTLSLEDRQLVNAKLRFFEGEAWEVYGQEIKPALEQFLEGGIADLTNLEQDMRDILKDWRDAAIDGVNLFATTELSNRIDDLESGSWKGFITTMIGNTIWAAAVFTPIGSASAAVAEAASAAVAEAASGAVAKAAAKAAAEAAAKAASAAVAAGQFKAFAISMTGVVVAAAPTIPAKSKSAIPQVQKLMGNYIYSIYDQLNADLRNKAHLLIKDDRGITRYRALGEFVENSFRSGFYKIDKDYEIVPALEKPAIRDRYEQIAANNLDIYTAIGQVPPDEYHVNEIAWIKYGGEKKLAMIEVDYFCAYGNCPPHEFKKWIPKESEAIAIEGWKSSPWSQGKMRTFESSDINFEK